MIALPMDRVVLTEGNRAAVSRVRRITGISSASQQVFLYGEPESGKTMLLVARTNERDMLSDKVVLYRKCGDLVRAFDGETYDDIFDVLDRVDVLLLDDFSEILGSATGRKLLGLLLNERIRNGVDTVVASRLPADRCVCPEFNGVLARFEEIEMQKLPDEKRSDYVWTLIREYAPPAVDLAVSGEAVSFLAGAGRYSLGELRSIVRRMIGRPIADAALRITLSDARRFVEGKAR
jgi:chromosomal replication initiation ATPase DnaA